MNAQIRKEREEMERDFANEMDSVTAQHRRALQHLRVRIFNRKCLRLLNSLVFSILIASVLRFIVM